MSGASEARKPEASKESIASLAKQKVRSTPRNVLNHGKHLLFDTTPGIVAWVAVTSPLWMAAETSYFLDRRKYRREKAAEAAAAATIADAVEVSLMPETSRTLTKRLAALGTAALITIPSTAEVSAEQPETPPPLSVQAPFTEQSY